MNKADVLDLRQSMEIVEHEAFRYYRLMARGFMGSEGYEAFSRSLREKNRIGGTL